MTRKRKFLYRALIGLLTAAMISMTFYTFHFQWKQGTSNKNKKISPPMTSSYSGKVFSLPLTILNEENLAKTEETVTEEILSGKKDKSILIYDWTGFFGNPISSHYNLDECPDLGCKLINNRSLIDESDAIVFHARDMNWSSLPETRYPWQYYVFFSLESPAYASTKFDDPRRYFFNVTMTYRRDSDVPISYGYFKQRKRKNDALNLSRIIERKSKMAAWFASNCHTASGREFYVKALRRAGVSVDIFGSCTDDHRLVCPRMLQSGCDRMLLDHYKFYFSFENSLCSDYVTEKFYDRIKNFVVPIVMERRNYDDVDMTPARSYIAVDDYPSMDDLARHLSYLNAHDDEYEKYLKWHEDYEVTKCPKNSGGCAFCDLCRLLMRRLKTKSQKPKIVDIQQWWHENGGCHRLPAAVIREYDRDDSTNNLLEMAFVFTAVGLMFVGVLFMAVLVAFRCLND